MRSDLSPEVARRLGAKLERLDLDDDERLLLELLLRAAGPPAEQAPEVEGHQLKGPSGTGLHRHPGRVDVKELVEIGFTFQTIQQDPGKAPPSDDWVQ